MSLFKRLNPDFFRIKIEAAIFSDFITKGFQIAWNFVNQVIISTLLIKFDVNFYFANVFPKIQLIPCRPNDLEN